MLCLRYLLMSCNISWSTFDKYRGVILHGFVLAMYALLPFLLAYGNDGMLVWLA
jgi:hypothetical protein